MADIILRDLRARRGIHIGHRTVPEGEVLTRLQFRSEDDARFFASHLRWSAFDMVPAVEESTSEEPKRRGRPAASPVV